MKEKSTLKDVANNYLTHTSLQSGITLIALVVTIVVLLILAGITISLVFSENGIIAKAREAAEKTNQATINEQEQMNELAGYIENMLNEIGGGDNQEGITGPNGKPLVETLTEIQTNNNVEAEDKYGNPVTVPKGFKVVASEATTVAEGIVIEDASGNQFVWIPTGTYKVDESGTSRTNELTRRQWGKTINVEQVPTQIVKDQVADGYMGEYYYGEGDSRSVAHDVIDNFLNSAKPVTEGGNGAFYIGRYEQGEGNVCKAGVNAHVNLTRDTAKLQAESMYTNKEQYGVTSELMSSYAWDTALNFICQNSEYGYILSTTTENIYGNIGTNSKAQTGRTTEDCYNNIYDFLGNYAEWTTEYSSYADGEGVPRGANYMLSCGWPASRNTITTSEENLSFRLSLYV